MSNVEGNICTVKLRIWEEELSGRGGATTAVAGSEVALHSARGSSWSIGYQQDFQQKQQQQLELVIQIPGWPRHRSTILKNHSERAEKPNSMYMR